MVDRIESADTLKIKWLPSTFFPLSTIITILSMWTIRLKVEENNSNNDNNFITLLDYNQLLDAYFFEVSSNCPRFVASNMLRQVCSLQTSDIFRGSKRPIRNCSACSPSTAAIAITCIFLIASFSK